MNKKQRNRKIVAQNKRNRIINRRYSSTIKTLFKLFLLKLKSKIVVPETEKTFIPKKIEINELVNNLYSVIDKAIKKKVIAKNTGARKKSKIGKLLSLRK